MKNKVFTAQLTNIKRNIRKNAKAPLTGSTELRNIRTNSKRINATSNFKNMTTIFQKYVSAAYLPIEK